MKPSTKFAIGSLLIVASVGTMIYEGIRTTSQYFLTPSELTARTAKDASFYNLGLKVSAKVVPGSIKRDDLDRRVDFTISDGSTSIPVTYSYVGNPLPDTFTDANDIDVVVEGKLEHDRVFHASDVIAKCGSRYDAAWKQPTRTS